MPDLPENTVFFARAQSAPFLSGPGRRKARQLRGLAVSASVRAAEKPGKKQERNRRPTGQGPDRNRRPPGQCRTPGDWFAHPKSHRQSRSGPSQREKGRFRALAPGSSLRGGRNDVALLATAFSTSSRKRRSRYRRTQGPHPLSLRFALLRSDESSRNPTASSPAPPQCPWSSGRPCGGRRSAGRGSRPSVSSSIPRPVAPTGPAGPCR